MHRIISATAHDVRFPTSRTLAGSDAMHTNPDYSAAYVVLRTDSSDHLEGHGLAFTLGRGTEVCVAAINALAPVVVGQTLDSITSASSRNPAPLGGPVKATSRSMSTRPGLASTGQSHNR